MKRILLSAAAIAGLISAASCQQENLEPIAKANKVTYTVQVADAVATKAIGDEIDAVNELVYEVYRTKGEGVVTFSEVDDNLLYHNTAKIENGVATLELEFVNDQNFTVLFWAHVAGNEVYDVKDLTKVTITSPDVANNVNAQAFVGRDFVRDCVSDAKGKVTLHRPVSQLNIGTTKASLTGYPVPFQNPVVLNGSTVKVTGLATTFDIAKMCATGELATEYTYTGQTIPAGDLTVAEVGYAYVAMNYIGFAPAEAEGATVTVSYVINTSEGDIDNVIENVPVKPNYRTNIIGNLITSKSDYIVELDAEWGTPDAGDIFIVKTDEELAAAVKSDAEIVEIILGADLNISAANAAALAGAETKKITISGNKSLSRTTTEYYTLTIKDAYNNVVKAVNPEAKLVLQDLNLTSNKEKGTWDIYDILFKNDVTLKNVNALQSSALDDTVQNAKFENLTITESHDYYALWICAAEMNVEWNGGEVNCPNGRGIKIDDEYLENPGHTTLTINNVVFNTKKKAAIVAKSSADVTVNTTKIDITNTVDPINEVWVDEDAAANYDKVTVNEGTDKALEGSGDVPVVVSTPEELQAAINAAKEGKNLIYFKNVIISDTNITVLQKVGVNIIIDGNDKEFDGTFILQGGEQGNSTETLIFQNINFKHEETGTFYFIDANSAEVAERYVHNVTVDNCTFEGSADAAALRFRQAYNLTVSNTSVVSGHSLLQAYGTTGITIDNVDVEAGRGVSLGTSTGVEIKNSEFTVNSYGVRGENDGKQYNINVSVVKSTIKSKQPIVIRRVTDADHTYALTLDNADLQTEEEYHVVFTNGADDAEYVKPTGKWSLTGADAYNVFPAPFPVATWDEFTKALADGEDWIKLTDNISNDSSYSLFNNVLLDLNGKTLAISGATNRLNIGSKNDGSKPKPTVTIKNGNINCKVYAQTGNLTLTDIKFGGSIAYTSDAQGVISVGGTANLLAERCDMASVKADAPETRPRALSSEGRSSGYLILRDCNFPSSGDGTGAFVKTKMLRTYITPLLGNATLEIANCKFGVACNIDLSASYVWSNMNLTGCSGGFTFTISRASTSFTEEETTIMKTIKKNNSGDVRLDWTDVTKMYIY